MPFATAQDSVRLAVRLAPKASADRVIGVAGEADGSVALKLAVTAVPEAGKANDALLKLLAKVLKLPRRDFAIVLGATDRRKLVRIAGDPERLRRHLEEGLRPWLRRD